MLKYFKYLFCWVFLLVVFAAAGNGDVSKFNNYGSGRTISISGNNNKNNSRNHSSYLRRRASSYNRSERTTEDENAGKRAYSKYHTSWLHRFVWFLICCVIYLLLGRKKNKKNYSSDQWIILPDNSKDIITAISKYDTSFNCDVFLQWVKEVFFKLQSAWQSRDWEQLRFFESDELYARHEQQLKEYKKNGRINIKEHITVNNAHLFMLKKDKSSETLSVALNVRMADYIIDEHTRTVLKGSADKDCCLSYLYVFKRKTNVNLSPDKQQADIIICPNCSAPTHIISSGKCEYCNFVITVKDNGWVLADIINIKEPESYGRGGVFTEESGEK